MPMGIWAVEPDGDIRDESQLKNVVWNVGQDLAGPNLWGFVWVWGVFGEGEGGSWEIVCIRMLD